MSHDEQSPGSAASPGPNVSFELLCRRCSFQLRGLPWNVNCPACGSPVEISRPSGLAALGVRAEPEVVSADTCCRRCGGSLQGQTVEDACPQCDLPVRESLSGQGWRSVVDEDGNISDDALCLRCGYNLRGLHESGRCPECGVPVELSTRGDFICYGDPRWTRRLARGSAWINRGLLGCLIVFVLSFVFALYATSGGWLSILAAVSLSIMVLVIFGCGFAAYIGAWMFTAPDPSRASADSQVTARRLARLSLLAGVLGASLDAMLEALAPGLIVLRLLTLPCSAMSVVGAVTYYNYAADIAQRIPDENLVRATKPLRWGFGIALSVIVSFTILGELMMLAPGTPAGARSFGPFFQVFACVTALAGLLLFVCVIGAASFQWRITKRLREQARRADVFWADATASPIPIQRGNGIRFS